MLKRSLCLLLALALLSGPAALAVRWERPISSCPDTAYADMLPVTPFEEDGLQAALKELEGICSRHSRSRGGEPSRRRAGVLYQQILSELDVLITKANLAGIQYDASGGAEAEAALYRELSAQQTRLYDRCYQVLAVLAASPYGDILDDDAGAGAAESLLGYRGLTEEEAALYEEEDLLVQTYDQIMSKGVPVLAADGIWTEDTLQSADVDAETYQTVREALDKERARAAGEIFRQLVRLRTQSAAQAGYDSYADHAYEALYTRDYSLEEVEPLREAAKRYLLPLQLRLLEDISDQDLRALSVRSRKSGEEILDAIAPFLESFDREMADTFAYMRRNHLYDIEYGEAKLPTGYTVALPAYGSAFIFNSPYGDYQDLSDMVHEFGHFHETIHSTRHDLWTDFNIDVGEIDSQALELMFTGSADELFGERYGAVYEEVILYNILDAVLDGCLYDEFQAAAYDDPGLSVEELDRIFKELSEEYGYSYDSGVEADPSWVENAHTFQNPMYFISYATSALSALDLWFLYLDAPRQGRETYLELSALSLSLPYRAAVEEVGLRDIFDPETIPALAEQLEAHLDGEAPASRRGAPHRAASAVMIFAAVVFILLCVAVVVRCTCFLNRNDGWKELAKPRKDRRGEDPPGEPWDARQERPPWEF